MTEINDIQLYHGDCLEVLPTLADKSVDAIICDLPYGKLKVSDKHNTWDVKLPFNRLWESWKRIVKPNGAIILFGAGAFSAELIMSQPKMYRYSLVWDKVCPVGWLHCNQMPLRRHEDILVFYQKLPTYNPQKGSDTKPRKPRKLSRLYPVKESLPTAGGSRYPTSVLEFSNAHRGGYHPTEKPCALLEYLIRTYTNEGDTVLDCTMGSGSTMVACVNTGRKGIGIELTEEYFDIAVRRVREAVPQPKLDLLGVASSDPSNP